jgi:Rps23 Pro-64 3,4-dihydroxylase Tpa1-like proline 4-hydroxylase
MKGLDLNVKKTYEVNIRGEKWQEIDNIISNVLTKNIINYGEIIYTLNNNNYILDQLKNNVTDTGYQIQKYIKGDGFYRWHNDSSIENKKSCRIVTFLFYLNDVEEGGETFFYNGKVKPEAGKLILFPATWTYNHKGNMPISNDKYIVTGWFYN